jgi:membrane protein YqaA with SNARE-associated domain
VEDIFGIALKYVLSFGLIGLFVLAALDSTFIFYLPFAIDAILIILVSKNESMMPYYALITTTGSIIGCLFTYLIISKTSEQSLEKMVSTRKFERVKRKMNKNGFWAIAIASALPPPFPFTPFLIMAAVVKLSIKKVIVAVFMGRLVRYLSEGLLAIYFGRRILRMLDSTIFKTFILIIFAVAILGSVISIYKWVKQRPKGSKSKQDVPSMESREKAA